MEGDLRCRLHASWTVKLIEGFYHRKFTFSTFSSHMYQRVINLRIGEEARLISQCKEYTLKGSTQFLSRRFSDQGGRKDDSFRHPGDSRIILDSWIILDYGDFSSFVNVSGLINFRVLRFVGVFDDEAELLLVAVRAYSSQKDHEGLECFFTLYELQYGLPHNLSLFTRKRINGKKVQKSSRLG